MNIYSEGRNMSGRLSSFKHSSSAPRPAWRSLGSVPHPLELWIQTECQYGLIWVASNPVAPCLWQACLAPCTQPGALIPFLALTMVIFYPQNDLKHKCRSQKKKKKFIRSPLVFVSKPSHWGGKWAPVPSERRVGEVVAVSREKDRSIPGNMLFVYGTWETLDCDHKNDCKTISFLTSSHSLFFWCRSWKIYTQMEWRKLTGAFLMD